MRRSSGLHSPSTEAFYVCVQHDPTPWFAPVFLVVNGRCQRQGWVVTATTAERKEYFIPARTKPLHPLACNDEGAIIKLGEPAEEPCQPGASTTALTIVSQLIALQKSAKDLPTTTVVRVVGQ